jgi:hypothetical protein
MRHADSRHATKRQEDAPETDLNSLFTTTVTKRSEVESAARLGACPQHLTWDSLAVAPASLAMMVVLATVRARSGWVHLLLFPVCLPIGK